MTPPESAMLMEIKGLVLDPSTKNPIVILQNAEHPQLVPIWIGVCEANAIAMVLEGVSSPRPMTHDLLKNVLTTLGMSLDYVFIHKLEAGTFYASIHLTRGESGAETEIDSRPSDALALAVRTHTPIFVSRAVVDEAGIADADQEEALRTILEQLRPEDLGDYEM